MNQVGRDIPRLEVRAKVTGRAEYTHNLRLPGMLYGKVFRAHGAARAHPQHRYASGAGSCAGVHRVITGEDIRKLIPEPYYGPAFHDQPILALDKVRYVGEPVAAVLASDPHVAEQAVQLIAAEYDELPAVYDEVAAMQPDTSGSRRAAACRHFCRSQTSARPQGHQCRARLSLAARRRRQSLCGRRSRDRAHVQDPAVPAFAIRVACRDRRTGRRSD